MINLLICTMRTLLPPPPPLKPITNTFRVQQVVGDTPSRPPSVTSQYSQVLKNSARFLFQPSQVTALGWQLGGGFWRGWDGILIIGINMIKSMIGLIDLFLFFEILEVA